MLGFFDRLQAYQPQVLGLLRIMTGLLFLQFGCAKILGILPWPSGQPAFLSLIWFAGMMELIGGALITVGFGTRLVAFLCSGEMAIGYFMSHFPRGFVPLTNGGNLAILFCFVFLYLAVAGGGAFSLDSARAKSSAM
ncbi:MAG: DoxX family protein [Candidatus Raskinella chloraquaticus]|uniref:DoxX family protein n=1 Tax=Candidatus Raskinella chloraquaticus TaxID=1951219 RepID=A0A1W9I511_9HYPH|nr:MAG: DoxX family protein [Proteobacteria bacterium SG_bin8]